MLSIFPLKTSSSKLLGLVYQRQKITTSASAPNAAFHFLVIALQLLS
jgi:hypothetical protein